ncbi:MAG: tRNA modification GTPase MnmE [Pseudomonadota bacterium]|jgi:tRNA modification GTPase
MQPDNSPIIAIATAAGRGGVGIVRLSGGKNVLHQLAYQLTGKQLTPRYATYTPFLDIETASINDGLSNNDGVLNGTPKKIIIDQGLALWFPAPHSYTGEDVLELQGHGGSVVLQLLLKRCLAIAAEHAINLRIAQPGEFTQRAFLNGQLDLAQAESVADLIEASTEAAAKAASRALSGAFSQRIHTLVHQLTQLRVLVEATLDFPEEEIDFLKTADAIGQLQRIQQQLNEVHEATKQGALLRDGIRVVLVGEPNVGKSSLLNALAQQDVAIVTAVAGTTRDTISQTIVLEGVSLDIVDTAGLRDTDDEVEQLGIERTWAQIKTAHVILRLYDATQAIYGNLDLELKLPSSLPVIYVLNKIDAIPQIGNKLPNYLAISAKTGQGLDTLKTELLRLAGWKINQSGEGIYIARERHIQALNAAQEQLSIAHDCAQMGDKSLDLFAESLRVTQQYLGEITGEFTSDDLLGVIFGQFCIGK